jgi:hypothetical protein
MTINKYTDVVFFLTSFCFLSLLPFLNAEVQPIGSVFALFGLIYFCKGKLPISLKLWCFFLFVNLIYSLTFLNIEMTSILTFVMLTTPLFSFHYFYKFHNKISLRVFTYVLYSWFLLCFLQLFFPQILSQFGIDKFLTLLIKRFSTGALTEFGRGVVIFSPEPSYAGHTLYFFSVFSLYAYHKKIINKRKTLFFFLTIVFMVMATASGTIGLIILINLLIYLIFSRNLYILFFVVPISLLLFNFFYELRIFKILYATVLTVSERYSFLDLLQLFTSFGSTREFSVSVAYTTIFNGNNFGYGIGSWSINFLDKMYEFGFDPGFVSRFNRDGFINLKPYSYGGLVAFDVGLIGITFFTLVYRKIFFNLKNISNVGKSIAITSLILIYFHTLTSLPLYWVTLALSLNMFKNEK